MTEPVVVTPAIDIQAVFGADGSRSFQMRFAPLPLDVSKEQLDEVLDRVLAAVDRQRAKYELFDAREKLQGQVDRIRKYEGMAVQLEERARAEWVAEGRRGEWSADKLSPTQRNARDQTNVSLQRDQAEAEALALRIDRLEGLVNGHASVSGADR